ncbi:hypothetical protein [Aeromonas sp. MrichA-1]|uniref:hypothetical protein n=1 Tax=Aeromonas TaxID=642 RepID=UPI001B34501E|nr:hypothetical protein [Aeromonas sp. MrichA-1]MBP4081656.1 hypothetical protein [Aeromonas sp. MrichA-1]
MEHIEFVALYRGKKLNLAYNVKKASKVFCDAFPEHGLSWLMQKFIKLRQNAYLLGLLALMCLLSPWKGLVFIVAIYALCQLGAEKMIRRYIEDNMVNNEKFYQAMIQNQVVFIAKHD